MPDKPSDTAIAAQQVELVIRRLDLLSTLPCVAARFFSKLLQPESSPSALADIIESDPALTARIFLLMHQQGLSLADGKFSFRRALDRMPAHVVRDEVLSVKVFQAFDADGSGSLLRKGLMQHGLAVACCAKDIAEILSAQVDSHLAYSAGLLHDIGKLALQQAMPKSFARIVEEAKSENTCTCTIEQKHLGLDHTILGKRLAQKWHLPEQITMAIWLHHSNTGAISQDMPEAKIAQIVRLADIIARQCGIGQSGSYDTPDSADAIARSLAISPEQIEQVRLGLGETVGEKSEVLGLDLPKPDVAYCDVVHATAAQLARDNTKLSLENRRLQTASSHFDFITDFLSSASSTDLPIEAAENFAVRWQKFYQTGMVCLYLIPPGDLPSPSDGRGLQMLEAVVVENLSQTKTIILNAPADLPPIPNKFAILNADGIDWLFEQLEADFDLSQSKLMPLLSGGKAVGAIVFELRYPADLELFRESFEATASVGGGVLDMAFARRKQQSFAERFVGLPGKAAEQQAGITTDTLLEPLAEMAAGAAHELNNPLSVISGRAQMLAKTEADPEKKQILKQIRQNTNKLSAIIEDLMTFAGPQQPRVARTDVKQIIREGVQLTSAKMNVEHVNVRIDVAEGVKDVFVDSAQVVSAIANVICNALESYTDRLGQVKITAAPESAGAFVKLAVSDLGCGMDARTVQKATQPFFSAKPAGRKRGMGLAHTARLIQLNGGVLHITSRPGSGTTVTISLPCK